MARKLDPSAQSAAATDTTESPLADLAIIHPDLTLTLAGREITVREYRFVEGMRARAKGKPLIDELETFLAGGEVLDAGTEDYLDLLARHGDLVRELMLDSIEGIDRDWMDGLDAEDGYQLQCAWWGVTGRFFVRRVLDGMREKMLRRLARRTSAGQTSSPASSTPDTAPSIASVPGTPSVN